MAETIPEKPVTIDNPEQASTNFFWTYETQSQIFNLQTTIRGVLTLDQIKAHIKSVLETSAHIYELGGIAKQIGKGAESVPASLPANSPLPATDDIPAAPVAPTGEPALAFNVEALDVSINNGKKYFKVKGGMYKKYGVTVWNEVLAKAGINWQALEAKPYDLAGYRAVYTLKADGKPDKVVLLEKIG